jgi:hypothetical protein
MSKLIGALTSLYLRRYRLKSYRASGAVDKRYYCEINIYITSCGKEPIPERPMR